MKLGSLPKHPDFNKLLSEVQILIDNHTEDVVREAERGEERQVRIAVGKRQAFSLLLDQLKEARRANEE
jgi:hypothetical protein